jgi:hypothetical protein
MLIFEKPNNLLHFPRDHQHYIGDNNDTSRLLCHQLPSYTPREMPFVESGLKSFYFFNEPDALENN